MAISWEKSQCKSKILKQIPHPSSFNHKNEVQNDIALLYIEELKIRQYGRLHSADYKTFAGRAVKYAGSGATALNLTVQESIDDIFRPIQIGEGIIFNDNDKSESLGRPQLLVAPKCSKKNQHIFKGDSGGPLFVDGKIVGVACAVPIRVLLNSHHHPAYFGFTPIGPYLDWIREVMGSF